MSLEQWLKIAKSNDSKTEENKDIISEEKEKLNISEINSTIQEINIDVNNSIK